MAGYRAILFDVYGTLLDVHGVAARAEDLFPGQGELLSQEWRRKQLEYTWLRTLAGWHADFWQVTGDALDYVAEAMRLELSSAARAILMDAYKALPAFADALPLLTALPLHDTPRAVLSNASPAMLQAALSAVQIAPLIDAVLSVEAVGRFKVAPEVYQLAIDRFGGTAGDFLLVSSNGWDVAGAGIFGFETFWVNRTGAPVERLGVAPTATGRSLADLAAWLQR